MGISKGVQPTHGWIPKPKGLYYSACKGNKKGAVLSTKTKIRPKWGVSGFRDAVIGPVQFNLITEAYLEDIVDPLNMQHWLFQGNDYECAPTRLFSSKKNAKLFADGARSARAKIIEAWGEDMTEKFDTQSEEEG